MQEDEPDGPTTRDGRGDADDGAGSGGDPRDVGQLEDPDDLEPLRSRLTARSRIVLAAVVAAALVLPLGGWLVDELAFRSSGDAVTDALGDDAALADALLLVRSVSCAGVVTTGSAFVIDLGAGPVVVTNRHVVEDAATVGLRPLDGGPALAVASHRLSGIADVAVVELVDPDARPSALRPGVGAAAGDEVRLVGFPAARPFTITGTVAVSEPTGLVLDLPTDPGASGSPVLDEQGHVVGQVYARTGGGSGLATPVDVLAEAAATATPAPSC